MNDQKSVSAEGRLQSDRETSVNDIVDVDATADDTVNALLRMAGGEDLSPSQVSEDRKRPSRKERMFPGGAKIDLKVRNHM